MQDIKATNIMLTTDDESMFAGFEKTERDEPSPRKVIDANRTIYTFGEFRLPKKGLGVDRSYVISAKLGLGGSIKETFSLKSTRLRRCCLRWNGTSGRYMECWRLSTVFALRALAVSFRIIIYTGLFTTDL